MENHRGPASKTGIYQGSGKIMKRPSVKYHMRHKPISFNLYIQAS